MYVFVRRSETYQQAQGVVHRRAHVLFGKGWGGEGKGPLAQSLVRAIERISAVRLGSEGAGCL